MWLGPPYMYRKMTIFALAAWCGFFGASGLTNLRDAVGGASLRREEIVAEQGGEGHAGEAAAGLPEELAPRAAAEVTCMISYSARFSHASQKRVRTMRSTCFCERC